MKHPPKLTLALLSMLCIATAVPAAQADCISPKMAEQAVEAVRHDRTYTAAKKLLLCADRVLHRKQSREDIKSILSSLEQLESLLTDKTYEGSPDECKKLMQVSEAGAMLQQAVVIVSLKEQYPAY
jgi:hypothetical protein